MATFEVGQRVPLGNGQFGEIIAVSEATAQQRANRDRILRRDDDDPRERRGNLPREFVAIRLPDGTTTGITVKDNGSLTLQRGQSTTGTGPISGGPSLSQLGGLIGSNLSATRGQNVDMSPEQRRALTFNQLRQGRRAAADVISDATGTPLTNQATGGQERGNMALPNLTGNDRQDTTLLSDAFRNGDITEQQFSRGLAAIGWPPSAISIRLNAIKNSSGFVPRGTDVTGEPIVESTVPRVETTTPGEVPPIGPDDFTDATVPRGLFELTPNEEISRFVTERFGSTINPAVRRAIGRRTQGLPGLFALSGAADPSNLTRSFRDFLGDEFQRPTSAGSLRNMLSEAAAGRGTDLFNELGISPNASTLSGFFGPTTDLVEEVAARGVSPFFRNAVRRRAGRQANEILLRDPAGISTAEDLLRELQVAGLF